MGNNIHLKLAEDGVYFTNANQSVICVCFISADDGVRSGRRADDNPFSFKRFLQPTGMRRGPASTGSPGIATLDLANDLPDFVQDYYHGERDHHVRGRGGRAQVTTDSPLPDFALDTDLGGRFHSGDAHPFGASAVGAWMHSDANGFPSSDDVARQSSDHWRQSPATDSGSAVRTSQLSDFSLSESENADNLDGFGLLDGCAHRGQSVETPTDGRLSIAANSAGGLPDFLSDSALGVADVYARNATAASVSNNMHTHRPLTNGISSPDSETESMLLRVNFLFFC